MHNVLWSLCKVSVSTRYTVLSSYACELCVECGGVSVAGIYIVTVSECVCVCVCVCVHVFCSRLAS